MLQVGAELAEGFEHKGAQMEQRVGQFQTWLVDDGASVFVGVEQQVEVYCAVVVAFALLGFVGSPQRDFYLLGHAEQFMGAEACFYAGGSVQERVWAVESPGLGFNKCRAPDDTCVVSVECS